MSNLIRVTLRLPRSASTIEVNPERDDRIARGAPILHTFRPHCNSQEVGTWDIDI